MDLYKNLSTFCLLISSLYLLQIFINIIYYVIKKHWNHESKIIVNNFKRFFILLLIFFVTLIVGVYSHFKNIYRYDFNLNEYTNITYIGKPTLQEVSGNKNYIYTNKKTVMSTYVESKKTDKLYISKLEKLYEDKGYKNIKSKKYRNIYVFEFIDQYFTKVYIYSDKENLYITAIAYKERNLILDFTLDAFPRYIKIMQ